MPQRFVVFAGGVPGHISLAQQFEDRRLVFAEPLQQFGGQGAGGPVAEFVAGANDGDAPTFDLSEDLLGGHQTSPQSSRSSLP
jgi:hypothetical protein